jgi:hypothetical protein
MPPASISQIGQGNAEAFATIASVNIGGSTAPGGGKAAAL